MRVSSEAITQMLYRLATQWPWDASLTAGKRSELEIFAREVGEKRAQEAITLTIQHFDGRFCPSIGTIREYLPQVRNAYVDVDPITEAERRDRAERPENWMSSADCVAMMRIIADRKAKGLPRLSHDDLWKAVSEIRERLQPRES